MLFAAVCVCMTNFIMLGNNIPHEVPNKPGLKAIKAPTERTPDNPVTLIVKTELPDGRQERVTEKSQEGMAACLHIKDDNHFLVEWLAYHYHYLPLRRLVVSIDPHSETSPMAILDRYHSRGMINVTAKVVVDKEFTHRNLSAYERHRWRQKEGISKCLKVLKREKKWTWVAVIDTDEYIVPNLQVDEKHGYPGTNKTVIRVLDKNTGHVEWKNNTKSACFPMSRRGVGIRDDTPEVSRRVGVGFNRTMFVTLRYGWVQIPSKGPPKALIDLSRAEWDDLRTGNIDVHRITKTCDRRMGMYIKQEQSPYVVYHYAGSLEQYMFRNDPRASRNQNKFFVKNYSKTWYDSTPQFWLQGFLDGVGPELAKVLLEDVGEVNPGKTSWGPLKLPLPPIW